MNFKKKISRPKMAEGGRLEIKKMVINDHKCQ